MRVEDVGIIKTIELPDSFGRGEIQMGGMGENWRRQFQPRDKKDADDVSIVSFYRGSPAANDDAAPFRFLLRQPPAIVYSSMKNRAGQTSQCSDVIRELEGVLGQCGNNQVANEETGFGGPRFHLEKLETISVGGKNVLSACGYFHDMDFRPQAYFAGLFLDAQPDSPQCFVEEFIFEAQTRPLFDKYYPSFEKAIASIEWKN